MNIYRKLRQQKKLTQKEVAEAVGLAPSRYGNYENDIRQPDNDTLVLLANFFNVSIDYLLGRDFTEKPLKTAKNTITIPVEQLSFVGCGNGVDNNDSSFFVDDEFEVPSEWIKKDISNYFIGFASGDSMEDIFVSDGIGLIFEKTSVLENGQVGLFHLNGKEYLKRYKVINNMPFLISENSRQNYDPIPVTEDDSFEIRAKLIYKIDYYNIK